MYDLQVAGLLGCDNHLGCPAKQLFGALRPPKEVEQVGDIGCQHRRVADLASHCDCLRNLYPPLSLGIGIEQRPAERARQAGAERRCRLGNLAQRFFEQPSWRRIGEEEIGAPRGLLIGQRRLRQNFG